MPQLQTPTPQLDWPGIARDLNGFLLESLQIHGQKLAEAQRQSVAQLEEMKRGAPLQVSQQDIAEVMTFQPSVAGSLRRGITAQEVLKMLEAPVYVPPGSKLIDTTKFASAQSKEAIVDTTPNLKHIPSFIRKLGMDRVIGSMPSDEIIQRLLNALGPERTTRFEQTTQRLVRQMLGEEFPVFRGLNARDVEFMRRGELPRAMGFSLKPTVAESIARSELMPVLRGTARPESVLMIPPTRAGFPTERELMLDPWRLIEPSLSQPAFLPAWGHPGADKNMALVKELLSQLYPRLR